MIAIARITPMLTYPDQTVTKASQLYRELTYEPRIPPSYLKITEVPSDRREQE